LDLARQVEQSFEILGGEEQLAASHGEGSRGRQRCFGKAVLVRVFDAPRITPISGPRERNVARKRAPREPLAKLLG
jgi:hypothetical protein